MSGEESVKGQLTELIRSLEKATGSKDGGNYLPPRDTIACPVVRQFEQKYADLFMEDSYARIEWFRSLNGCSLDEALSAVYSSPMFEMKTRKLALELLEKVVV